MILLYSWLPRGTQGFFEWFCDVGKSEDHLQNNLARFGYIFG